MKDMGQLLGAIFLSVIITGSGMYIAFPYLYPTLKSDNADLVTQDDIKDFITADNLTADEGILLQSKYQQFTDHAYIQSSQTSLLEIPGTKMNITIQENSRISAVFSTPTSLSLTSTADRVISFQIILAIEGVGNISTLVISVDDENDISYYRIRTDHIHLYYETEELPAGVYNIQTFYKSFIDASGGALMLSDNPEKDYPRILLVQELK
ncbi:hypothetical protein NEF87_002231 [Candidatus Lokiarchaeum ossiferum]|uniref:Uncharacterized protein n=1 Tax=Candidatus Lokiarchaeum ossiferum TaxID=2951803 RepID=A0ABY6HTR2_9ARCH|nr:hypothetical protein NEF87_002231 [Candidatus Lokiarchaeum sp. B-35]